MNELNCPAQTHGSIAVCRFCVFTGGAPSAICVRMVERYREQQTAKLVAPIVTPRPVTPLDVLKAD